MFKLVFVFLLSYFLGAIPFGYVSVRLIKGIDIREHGSGNTGATNVLRTAGPLAAIITMVGDVLKSVLAIKIAQALIDAPILGLNVKTILLICGLIAILGHSFSVFLNFQGGKGVATTLGALIALLPYLIPLVLMVWIPIVITTRYVSLASMLAGVAIPILLAIFHEPIEFIIAGLLIAVFVIYRHRSNVQRLINGTENKIQWRRSQSRKLR